MTLHMRVLLHAVPLMIVAAAPAAAVAATAEETLVAPAKTGPMHKLGPWLGHLHAEFQLAPDKKAFRTRNPVVKVRNGMVGVDLYANDAASLQASLASMGATRVRVNGPLVSAQVPVAALGQLAALSSLNFGDAALAFTRGASQGNVVSQGDAAMGADVARATYKVDGTGVTVGVMSDSYQCNPAAFLAGAPTATAAEDVATGDVPANVQVLDNGECPGTDEGRAMVQLVRDVAPGATQKFHTAFNSLNDFAAGILELRAAGADVIVDDVGYFAENMFSDGIIAQAADQAVKLGAAYFSAAGNDARLSYESAYREVAVPTSGGGNVNGDGTPFVLRAHDFGGGPAGADTLQKINVTQSGGQAVILFSFQWDQPFLTSTTYAHMTDPTPTSQARGATGDMDMLFYDENGTLVPDCPPGVSTGITCQITGTRNIGRDAVDLALLVVNGGAKQSGDFFVRFVRAGGTAPQHIKYVATEVQGTVDIVTHDTRSGTSYGHPNAANVAAVGASSWYLTAKFDSYFSALVNDTAGACNPACVNDFSSAGGVPIYLDKYGVPVPSLPLRQTPRFTGPDGGNTTFFLGDSSFDDDDRDGCNGPTSKFITSCLDNPAHELPNFFGTSAAAPHVAAVAALMLEKSRKKGALAPQTIYSMLAGTAKDIRKREVEVVPGVGNSVFSTLPTGYDFDSGYGFVDAAAAVGAAGKP